MKIFTDTILASITGATTYTAPTTRPKSFTSYLRISDTHIDGTTSEGEVVAISIPPMKTWFLLWMDVSFIMDGSMARDVGFDPIGFKNPKDLMNYCEARIKHAQRVTMFAVAGWPLSELCVNNLAILLSIPPLLDANDQVY